MNQIKQKTVPVCMRSLYDNPCSAEMCGLEERDLLLGTLIFIVSKWEFAILLLSLSQIGEIFGLN